MQRRRQIGGSGLSAGFTLIEVLVVVTIITLLLSILVPALGAARRTARRVCCAANLREIGHAVAYYVDTHQGALPTAEARLGDSGPANWWENRDFLSTLTLAPLPQERSVLTCPADDRPECYTNRRRKPCWASYAANTSCLGMRRAGSKRGRVLTRVCEPAETLAFCDGQFEDGEALVVGYQGCVNRAFAFRHDGQAQVVFLDFHVALIAPADIPVDDAERKAWQDPFWGGIPQLW